MNDILQFLKAKEVNLGYLAKSMMELLVIIAVNRVQPQTIVAESFIIHAAS